MKLSEIEAITAKANEGPWKFDCDSVWKWHEDDPSDEPHQTKICKGPNPAGWKTEWPRLDDAEFIAMARNELPKLLAVVKAVKIANEFSSFRFPDSVMTALEAFEE
jgi:hypothetical protein